MVWQRIGEFVFFRLDVPTNFIICILSWASLLVRCYLLSFFPFSALSYIAVNQEKYPQSVKEIDHVSFFHHLYITIILLT